MASFAALFAAKPRAAAPPEEPPPDSLFEGKKKKRKRGGAAAPQPPAIRASRELNKELTRLARGQHGGQRRGRVARTLFSIKPINKSFSSYGLALSKKYLF